MPQDFDFEALADGSATTVIYMPAATLAEIACRAIARGANPCLPAVAVIAATRPDEVVITGTLATLPAQLSARSETGPVLIFVGDAFAPAALIAEHPAMLQRLDWLLTRGTATNQALAS